jgi:hypothetical protein
VGARLALCLWLLARDLCPHHHRRRRRRRRVPLQVAAYEEERRVAALRVAEGRLRNVEMKKENQEGQRLKAIERQRDAEAAKIHEVHRRWRPVGCGVVCTK